MRTSRSSSATGGADLSGTKTDSTRLDAALVERGLAATRSQAQALILAGSVRVSGKVAGRSGARVGPEDELSVVKKPPFVSRAGEKLSGALDFFGVPVEGRLCLDAGASTGGFTDALLKRGAARVISVDVGYGQLDWNLRNDERVSVMERTNVRNLSGEDLPFAPDLLVADLSFISLSVALSNLLETTPSVREALVLVKPQFEAGPEQVGRGGLVRDRTIHEKVVLGAAEAFEGLGFGAVGVVRAAVVGKKSKNQEYVMRLVRGEKRSLDAGGVREVVGGR